jgi:hypothetical protein
LGLGKNEIKEDLEVGAILKIKRVGVERLDRQLVRSRKVAVLAKAGASVNTGPGSTAAPC